MARSRPGGRVLGLNGERQARLHATTAFLPERPEEWVFFQELSQAGI